MSFGLGTAGENFKEPIETIMVNKVILIGNVGMDPEVRALEGGAKVARLRIATTERIYNRQTQETKEHTEWHTVTLWRGLADVADRYVRKGSQVYIEGSLRTREWTDKDNNKRYTTEIVANDMKMLGRRAEGTGAPMDGTTYALPISVLRYARSVLRRRRDSGCRAGRSRRPAFLICRTGDRLIGCRPHARHGRGMTFPEARMLRRMPLRQGRCARFLTGRIHKAEER